MCSAATLTSLLLLLVSVPLFAQDQPIKFRGAYIGQPLSDYVDFIGERAEARARLQDPREAVRGATRLSVAREIPRQSC